MTQSRKARRRTLSDRAVKELCQILKLLADETRLRILLHLASGRELNVSQLCARLDQSQPSVSHHLALMREAGIIQSRREGKHNWYSVRRGRFERVGPDPAAGNAFGTVLRIKGFVLSYEG